MKTRNIRNNSKSLVDKVRKYALSQKELWKKIPALALEADGRTGHSGCFFRAYADKYWELYSSIESGYFQVYVDLRTGKLVDAFYASNFGAMGETIENTHKKSVPAKDDKILKLANNLEELNAKKIIKYLVEQSKQPYGSYYNPEEKEKWREEMRNKYKLKKPELEMIV